MNIPKPIDNAVKHYAVMNILASIIASPTGMSSIAQFAEERGLGKDIAAAAMAEQFAIAGIAQVERTQLFSLPNGPIADLLQLFADVSSIESRIELDDRQTEGELGTNAVALILNEPGYWYDESALNPQATDGDRIEFPGSGANGGEERLNDLIRAGAFLLAEIQRVARTIAAEDAMAVKGAQVGEALTDLTGGDVAIVDAEDRG